MSVQDGEKVHILSQKSGGGFHIPFMFYGNFSIGKEDLKPLSNPLRQEKPSTSTIWA